MKFKLFCIVVFCLLQLNAYAQDEVTAITVEAGDNQGLIDAVNAANAGTGLFLITLVPNADGGTEFVFDMPIPGTQSALPVITSKFHIATADSSSQHIHFADF